MRRWTLALLVLLAVTPLAAAQPEPEEVVRAACAVAPVDLPVCPPVDPAPAPAPASSGHAHAAPAASPEGAAALAEDVRADVEGAVEDPAGAPERVASVVATVARFVKDLLGLPQRALAVLDEARVGVVASVGGIVEGVREALADLFARVEAPRLPDAAAPTGPVGEDAAGLVASLVDGVRLSA